MCKSSEPSRATTPSVAFPLLPLCVAQTIPAIGFGVGTSWYKCPDERKQALRKAVSSALDAGLTHLDEAEMYANEEVTGEALQDWLAAHPEVPRERLHITSKVMSVDHEDGIESVVRKSLRALHAEYFDLYLVHAPFQRDGGTPFQKSLLEVWREMELLVDKGLCRAIGVSNWRVSDLRQIFDEARIKPCCNQIEAHPYLQQPTLQAYCAERGILLTAYAPLAPLTKLAGGPVDAPIAAAAEAHGASPAQVLLRWCLQTGMGAITTTGRPARLEEYKGALSFELTPQEVDAISAAGRERQRRLYWTQCSPMFNADPALETDG